MTFMPPVNYRFDLYGNQYIVPPARVGVTFPLESEGGKANVIRVQNLADSSYWALKAFKYEYRSESQVKAVKRLAMVQHLPGLQAARQTVIHPTDPLAVKEDELEWAVLMPWVHGQTWGEVLGNVNSGAKAYKRADAEAYAFRLVEILARLENERHVHCDLSAGNVMLRSGQQMNFELIDLEDMLIQGAAEAPSSLTPGTVGYGLHGVDKTAVPEGDRYAGAILIAEALALSSPYAVSLASNEGMFRGNRGDLGNQSNVLAQKRFDSVYDDLRTWKPVFAEMLRTAWHAKTLNDCPRIAQVADSLTRTQPLQPVLPIPGGGRFDTPVPNIPVSAEVASKFPPLLQPGMPSAGAPPPPPVTVSPFAAQKGVQGSGAGVGPGVVRPGALPMQAGAKPTAPPRVPGGQNPPSSVPSQTPRWVYFLTAILVPLVLYWLGGSPTIVLAVGGPVSVLFAIIGVTTKAPGKGNSP